MNLPLKIYLAWVVRTALLVLYIPVQILSVMIQVAHRLDLWACAVVMQSSSQSGNRQFTTAPGDRAMFFAAGTKALS